MDDYWEWLYSTLVPGIRAQEWYNGAPPRNLSGFIADRNNRIIGWPRMRQLRVTPGLSSSFISRVSSSSSEQHPTVVSSAWSRRMDASARPITVLRTKSVDPSHQDGYPQPISPSPDPSPTPLSTDRAATSSPTPSPPITPPMEVEDSCTSSVAV